MSSLTHLASNFSLSVLVNLPPRAMVTMAPTSQPATSMPWAQTA